MVDEPVALITGAGSGIGRATAIELASLGWRLVLVGRTDWKLDETKGLIADRISEPVDFMSTPVDLGEDEVPEAIIEGVAEYWGRLDAIVNNAAVCPIGPMAETSPQQVVETFRINTFAVFTLIAHAWKLFAHTAQECAGSRPCVVNVSSMATVSPYPGLSAYAASKAACESLVRSVVNEADGLDLRAFAIAPGAVETPMLRSLFGTDVVPEDKALDPRVIARKIIACINGDHDDLNGQVIEMPSPMLD